MGLISPTLRVMLDTSDKAARDLRRDFGEIENLQASRKGIDDFVSRALSRSASVLCDSLLHARPGYGLACRSRDVIVGSDKTHRWVIDPLVGSVNFLHGIPYFGISIALERDGVLVAGLIYSPVTDESYHAERGNGAWFNQRYRLRVSSRTHLDSAVIGYGSAIDDDVGCERLLSELRAVELRAHEIRRHGAAALDLAYIAAGRLDGFWARGLGTDELAAGIVLVREAGGFVTDMQNRSRSFAAGEVIVGNEAIHGALYDLLPRDAV